MNGIVGFKPTVGVISQELIVPISSTQDTAGPMTLTVKGAAMMMDGLTENDGSYVASLGSVDPASTRIGVLNFAIGENAAALEDLKGKGFALIEIDAWEPSEGFGKASYDVLKYEFKATLNEYLASTTDAVKTRTLSELIAFNNGEMMADNNVQFLMAPSTAPTFLVDHMYGDTYPGGTGAGWVAAIAGYPHITVPMGTYKGLPTGVFFSPHWSKRKMARC